MPKFSVKKPFTVLVGVVLVLVLGIVSLTGMPTDLLPSISLPYLLVITTYPGASPERVESDISAPLESALGTVNGVENVTSTSSENYSMLVLEFAEDTDMDSAMVKVSTQINQLADTLPELAGTPSIMEMSADMMATQYVAVDYEGMDIYELSAYAEDTVIPALERVNGVASVSATGLVEKTVEVTLKQDKIDDINDRLLVKVSDRLAEAKQQLEDAEAELDANAAKLEDGQAQLEQGQQQLEAQQKSMAEQLNSAIAAVDEEIPAITQQIADLEGTIQNGEDGLNNAAGQLASLSAQLGASEGDAFKNLNSALATWDPQYDQVAGQLPTSLDDALANNAAKLDVLTEALVRMRQNVEGNLKSSEETNNQLAELDAQLAAANTAVAELQIQNVQLGDEIAATGQAIAEAEAAGGDTSELQAQLAALNEQYAANSAQLTQAQQQQQALQASRDALAASILPAPGFLPDTETINQIITLLGTIKQLRPTIDTARATLQSLQARLGELNAYREQLEATMRGLEENPLDATLGDTASMLLFSGLNAQLAVSEGQLTSGQAQIEAGRTQIDAAWEEYETAREEALKQANLNSLLNMQTLAQLISAQNFSMPAGYIQDGGESYLLKVGDAFETVDELSGALLCSVDGIGDVRLSDVADIVVTDNSGDSYAKMDGNQAVLLAIYKGSTASTSEVSQACNEAAASLVAANPGLRLTAIMDQGDYIRLIVNNVVSNLVWGALLAILVLALFLKDVRPTLVVAISIPLSVLFAIVMMYFTGISLNIISLSGLALGIGMLVDNSIVVIENIYRLRNRGLPPARAAVQGARQVTSAIIASTLTTICVFLPLIFSEGITRELLTDMALTIGYSLIASLIVALTVVPCAGSTLLKKTADKKHPLFDKMTEVYDKLLRFCLKVKVVPLALAIGLLAVSIWQMSQMGLVLIPEMGSEELSVTLELPDDTSDETAFATADTVMERIQQVEGIDTVGAMTSASMMAAMGGGAGTGGSADNSEFTYYLLLSEDGARDQQRIKDEIAARTADVQGTVTVSSASSMDMSALTGSGVEVDIYGQDLDTLLQLSEQVEAIMAEVPGIANISNGQEAGDEEVRVVVDKDKAMRLGLTVAQVYAELAQALTTDTTSTTLTVGEDTYTVEIIDTTKTPELADIFSYEFETTTTDENGAQVKETHTLGEFASRQNAAGVASIARENQSRYMSVTSETLEGYNTTRLSQQVQQKLDALTLPDGYTAEIGGESTQVYDMVEQMAKMLALALVLIYLVMVAQFQSLLSPFIVLFTIPLAFTGGILAMLMAGETLSLLSLMGFLVLMGVIVNNGIVFVDYTNQLRIGGLPRREALVATGKTRMRPILMTTLTTVLAMVTMLVSTDPGSEMGRGMAIVIIGGLLYATLMTLFIVPVMYDIFFRKAPVNIDVGNDGLDDLPDDAAEFLAQLKAREAVTAPSPAEGGEQV